MPGGFKKRKHFSTKLFQMSLVSKPGNSFCGLHSHISDIHGENSWWLKNLSKILPFNINAAFSDIETIIFFSGNGSHLVFKSTQNSLSTSKIS